MAHTGRDWRTWPMVRFPRDWRADLRVVVSNKRMMDYADHAAPE